MSATTETIDLLYGGMLYRDWLSYDVGADLRRPAAAFRLTARPPEEFDALTLEPGSVAELQVGGITVLWGRVDEVSLRRARDRIAVEIAGRDAGGLLVDAAADYTWTWRKVTLSVIASTVCTYAGLIRPAVLASDPLVAEAKAEPGESCWTLLDRLASAQGLRLWIAADGHLEIGNYATVGAFVGGLRDVPGLVGNTILSSEVRRSFAAAASELIVLGHYDDGSRHAAFRGEWIDTTAPYFKPQVVVDSSVESADAATAKARELGTRGKSTRFEARYTVRGHQRMPGLPWTINELIHVADPRHGIDAPLLVVERRFRRSREEGTVTELALVQPEDFDA